MAAQADGSGARASVHAASAGRVAVPRALMMHDGRMVHHQMHPGMAPGMGFGGHGPMPMQAASSRMPTHPQHPGAGLLPGHAAQYGHQMHQPHHHQHLQYLPSQLPRMAPLPSAQDYALLSARPYIPAPSADVRAAAAALAGASSFASSAPPDQHQIRPPSMTFVGGGGAAELPAAAGALVGEAGAKGARTGARPQPTQLPTSHASVRDGPAVRPPDISERDAPASGQTSLSRGASREEGAAPKAGNLPQVVVASPEPEEAPPTSGPSPQGADAPGKALSDRSQSSRSDCRGPAAGGRMLTIGVGGAVPLMPADAASLCEAIALANSLEKAPLAKAVEAIRDLPMPTVIVEYADVSRLPLDAVPAMLATPHSDSQSMSSGPVATKRRRESFADDGGASGGEAGGDASGLASKRPRPAEEPTEANATSSSAERPPAGPQPAESAEQAASAAAPGQPAAAAAAAEPASNGQAADSASTCAERSTPSRGPPGTAGARNRSAAAFAEAGRKDGDQEDDIADEFGDDDDDDDDDDVPMQWAPIALESNDLAVRLFNNTREQVAEDAKNGVELAWIHPHEVARRATVSIKANSRRMSQFTYDGLYISRVHPPPGQAVTKDGVALVPFATFRATEVMVLFYDGRSDRLKRTFTFWVGIVPTGSVLPAGTLVVPKHVSQSLESTRRPGQQSADGEHGSAPASPRLVVGNGGAAGSAATGAAAAEAAGAAAASEAAVSTAAAVSRGEPFVPARSAPAIDAWALSRSHMEQGHLTSEPGEVPASMFAPGIQRSHPAITGGYSTAMSSMHHSRPPAPRHGPYSDAMDADSGPEHQSGLWAHSIGGLAGLFPLASAMASVREHQLPQHFLTAGPSSGALVHLQHQQQMSLAQQHQHQQRQMNSHPGSSDHGHGSSHAQPFTSQGWAATR